MNRFLDKEPLQIDSILQSSKTCTEEELIFLIDKYYSSEMPDTDTLHRYILFALILDMDISKYVINSHILKECNNINKIPLLICMYKDSPYWLLDMVKGLDIYNDSHIVGHLNVSQKTFEELVNKAIGNVEYFQNGSLFFRNALSSSKINFDIASKILEWCEDSMVNLHVKDICKVTITITKAKMFDIVNSSWNLKKMMRMHSEQKSKISK